MALSPIAPIPQLFAIKHEIHDGAMHDYIFPRSNEKDFSMFHYWPRRVIVCTGFMYFLFYGCDFGVSVFQCLLFR